MSARPQLGFEPTQIRSRGPWLRCSLAPAIHEQVEAAHEHTLAWALALGLTERSCGRLIAARFSWLAARAYAWVDREQLDLASDWLTFLFAYDDRCDVLTEAHEPGLAAVEDRLMAVARTRRGAGPEPLERALADILARASERASAAWLDRLGARICDYIHGCRWERSLQRAQQVPSLATYTKLRLLISAVFPCFDLAGLFIDGRRTDFAEPVLVQQLEVMANNHICWVNDIYGLDRDLGQGSTSNLVILLAHERGLDHAVALDHAIELCNREFEAFAALARLVRAEVATGVEPARGEAYIAALEAWMRGNLDWYADTKRYRSFSHATT